MTMKNIIIFKNSNQIIGHIKKEYHIQLTGKLLKK